MKLNSLKKKFIYANIFILIVISCILIYHIIVNVFHYEKREFGKMPVILRGFEDGEEK